MMNHTFSIPAYKESPYLERCLRSLQKQTIQSEIILTTSTPSKFLNDICLKYNLKYLVNSEPGGIASDWNFAFRQAKTKYLTLAHQDDIYLPAYTESTLKKVKKYLRLEPSIIFTDYYECDQKDNLRITNLLRIKKFLLLPAVFSEKLKSPFWKKSILAFGSSISCPGVTYNLDLLRKYNFKFDEDFTVDLDWKAWHDLAETEGAFLFINKRLFAHRIHEEAETTNALSDNRRYIEDEIMFEKFWPKAMAKFLLKIYTLSYKYNR